MPQQQQQHGLSSGSASPQQRTADEMRMLAVWCAHFEPCPGCPYADASRASCGCDDAQHVVTDELAALRKRYVPLGGPAAKGAHERLSRLLVSEGLELTECRTHVAVLGPHAAHPGLVFGWVRRPEPLALPTLSEAEAAQARLDDADAASRRAHVYAPARSSRCQMLSRFH